MHLLSSLAVHDTVVMFAHNFLECVATDTMCVPMDVVGSIQH